MRAASRSGVLTVLIVAVMQAGCRAKAVPQDDLSRRATEALRKRCASAGDRIEPAPSVRAVVEHEGTRDPVVESKGTRHGDSLAAIRFEVLSGTDVVPDLTFGSVGVGPSAEEARTNAGQDWVALFADPYCAAQAAAPDGVRVGGFVAYPSLLALRGEHPGGWLKDDGARNRRVLDAAAPLRAPRGPGGIGLLDVKVTVQDGEKTDGECRMNGSLDVAACERIISLPWPAGTYMYKQAFAYKAGAP